MSTETATEHPARAMARRSMEIVQQKGEGARERWLALWDEDGIVEDPIGPSPMDPSGEGYRGKAAIARFWDLAIGPTDVTFDIERSYACGNEVANVGCIRTRTPDGTTAVCHGVFTYRINDAGKLVALRAYWEFDQMMATMQKT